MGQIQLHVGDIGAIAMFNKIDEIVLAITFVKNDVDYPANKSLSIENGWVVPNEITKSTGKFYVRIETINRTFITESENVIGWINSDGEDKIAEGREDYWEIQ